MNFRAQIAPRLTPVRILLTICLLVFSTSAFDCGLDPEPPVSPFPGGIRVETRERAAFIPGSSTRVGGVPNSGIATNIVGPGTGNQNSFAGPTNANGIRDWPLARTNAHWTLSVTYTTVISVCGSKSFPGIYVPTTGLWMVWTCIIG